MEHLFYDGNFYSELSEYLEYHDIKREEVESYPDDYKLEMNGSKLEPIVQFDAEWISERICEERFSENNCDSETSKIMKALNDCIDFDKLNSQIPKLYYENRRDKCVFTKADLLELL